MLRNDIEMKASLIEQYKASKLNDRTTEEKCKLLQNLNTKLKTEKKRLEEQVLKLTTELSEKTEEFRRSIHEMKEQTEASKLILNLRI